MNNNHMVNIPPSYKRNDDATVFSIPNLFLGSENYFECQNCQHYLSAEAALNSDNGEDEGWLVV
ncbi:hypothetical protein DERP_009870 [Dermatophagoides pteronyssinus]|uniref:Uncharacterized protein n=1 Tax=Dermatophagoides pteronyssinus TaxID=6956 RepID=A0ABQ8J1V7_DERPT|nr:hypothetical protein DERP_009870 [Dermatophagoides pteronyssinus]